MCQVIGWASSAQREEVLWPATPHVGLGKGLGPLRSPTDGRTATSLALHWLRLRRGLVTSHCMRRSPYAISFRRGRSRGLAAVVSVIPLSPLSGLPVRHVRPGARGRGGPNEYGRPPSRDPLGHSPEPAGLFLDHPAAGGAAA